MKKIILSLLLALGVTSFVQAQNVTLSGTVLAGTGTNIFIGAFKITSIVLTSTNTGTAIIWDSGGTNAAGQILTNYTTVSYSQVASYLTNSALIAASATYSQFYYTDYFGKITSLTNSWGPTDKGSTNYVLIDVTNTVSGATYPNPSLNLAVQANVPLNLNPVNATFYRGISILNTSASLTPAINYTITGTRQ